MLFAISGSQGSGKSTTLNYLENNGFEIVKRKISRSILSDWKVTLDEVNSDMELTLKFQDEILKRKFQDEVNFSLSNKIHFTERTFTDSFVYYMFSFGRISTMGNHIDAYYKKCVEYNQIYSAVFQLPTGKFQTVDDGVRNPNSLYGESISITLDYFLNKEFLDNRLFLVEEVPPEKRADYIIDTINKNFS